jgi:hypothetical protein
MLEWLTFGGVVVAIVLLLIALFSLPSAPEGPEKKAPPEDMPLGKFQAYSDLQYLVSDLERREHVQFSWGAREMLIVPLLESYDPRGPGLDRDQAQESIRLIIESLKEGRDSDTPRKLNSIDIIRGFFKSFCKIPPFCSRREL